MNAFKAHDFEQIYKELGLDLTQLGCIMLDVSLVGVPEFPAKGHLYTSPDPKKFWIKGFVALENPHVTLLYGLLKTGGEYRKYVEQVLADWQPPSLEIEDVSFFESPYEDEPYYCIVAHMKITPELLEGHQRLELLPHIDTFPGYKAHLTLAYIQKDEAIRAIVIDYYKNNLVGKELRVTGINFGGNKP